MIPIPSIKEIVKDNVVHFHKYRAGYFYYMVPLFDRDNDNAVYWYVFPVPQSDIGDATLQREDKAIIFMRYIRKAIDEGTFLALQK
jgi:hypothetical protein